MNRAYNFSAGPAVMPEWVLKKAQAEMLDYNGSGMSVMEMSHRSKIYEEIIGGAEEKLRQLLKIPNNYKVLFLTGGASTQFSMAPMNLMKRGEIDLLLTGVWTQKAKEEALRYGKVNVVASSEDNGFSSIPNIDPGNFNDKADYFHLCTNNTIFGTCLFELPDTKNVPIVADMSSDILSHPIDVSKFGLIFAGAQKNIGPAGVTIAIIRDDLLGFSLPYTPTMMKYDTHVKEKSLYNTPPTYSIYLCSLVLDWIESLGGLEAVAKLNEEKAALLYDYLDSSKLFIPYAEKNDRSLMNVTFKTNSSNMDEQFITEAERAGFLNLKGHRLSGGMRASIYNAMPKDHVSELVEFMRRFESKNI